MRILVLGGYGNFGKRLVKSLIEYSANEVIIAGRNILKANQLAVLIAQEFPDRISAIKLDALDQNLDKKIEKQKPDIVVNASGPFHFQTSFKQKNGSQNYNVPRACLYAKCHYIDLADNRDFVCNFRESLNKRAKKLNLVFVTGASTVPSLTDAVIQHYLCQFSELNSIKFGISPGNRTERGNSTVASILSYTGKPFKTLSNGKQRTIFGWQNLSRYDFGLPIGPRWMSNCDIPDLELLPLKYPNLTSVNFQAGLEVSILHLGLWFLSLISRIGIVKNWSRFSKTLTKMSELFSTLGSDSGGMFIEMSGVGLNKKSKRICWQLVAEDGVGPNVPVIPAELIIKKLEQNKLKSGASPCMGLFTLDEFFNVADRWNIFQKEVNDE